MVCCNLKQGGSPYAGESCPGGRAPGRTGSPEWAWENFPTGQVGVRELAKGSTWSGWSRRVLKRTCLEARGTDGSKEEAVSHVLRGLRKDTGLYEVFVEDFMNNSLHVLFMCVVEEEPLQSEKP